MDECQATASREVHLRGHVCVKGFERLRELFHARSDVDLRGCVGRVEVEVALRGVEVVLGAVAHDVGIY